MTVRPGLANYSANGARAGAPCLEKLTCAVFGDDVASKAELDVCWKQAQLVVEVTPQVRSFCADYARVWFECGYSLPIDVCERRYAMWAASVVDKLTLCVAEPTCDALHACDTVVFANL
jgi:hypothetical protein